MEKLSEEKIKALQAALGKSDVHVLIYHLMCVQNICSKIFGDDVMKEALNDLYGDSINRMLSKQGNGITKNAKDIENEELSELDTIN